VPRGTAHRPAPVAGSHSLHLTLSAGRRVPGTSPAPAAGPEGDGFLPMPQVLFRIQQRAHQALSRRAQDGPPRLAGPLPAAAGLGDADSLREALARLDPAGTAG
jgi:hypothetical protein